MRISPCIVSVVPYRGLALGELEAGAGCLAAVFLTLFDAGVAGDEAGLLEVAAQFGITGQQGLGDAVADRSGLA